MNMMLDNMMRKTSGEPLHVLVDIGYVDHQSARDNADKLMEHLGRKNFQACGFSRLMARIPPSKLTGILRLFPEITEGGRYSGTTHTFGSGPQFSLPHQREAP